MRLNQEHWTASGPPIGNSPRPSHSTPFSAAGHQPVEGQRHPLDPPPPHSITGGGRPNLTFKKNLCSVLLPFIIIVFFYFFLYIFFYKKFMPISARGITVAQANSECTLITIRMYLSVI